MPRRGGSRGVGMWICRSGRKSEVDLSDVSFCGKDALVSVRNDDSALQHECQHSLRPSRVRLPTVYSTCRRPSRIFDTLAASFPRKEPCSILSKLPAALA